LANTGKTGRTKFSRRARLGLAAAGVALLGLLAITALLKPSPLAHGTHEQLGLPPCTFWVLFGRPCPTCGMTTAWAYLMRGEWTAAAQANLGGMLLGVLALAAAPWLLGSAACGRWLGISPSGKQAVSIAVVILSVTLIQWLLRLLAG
jgi:hypothetical protein